MAAAAMDVMAAVPTAWFLRGQEPANNKNQR
jgi:hypothetical protein